MLHEAVSVKDETFDFGKINMFLFLRISINTLILRQWVATEIFLFFCELCIDLVGTFVHLWRTSF